MTSFSHFTSRIGEGNGNPLQCSCLENPRDGGAWWAAIYGVAQSWILLKQLSSSSSSHISVDRDKEVKITKLPYKKYFKHEDKETGHSIAAAKSLQSCPILCDPIDGSPSGSPVPGILQARTLEWVAISFSNA